MRLIDADALMQNIPSEEMIAKMAVAHAPSINVVFCKECKKHNTHRCHMAFDLVATNDDDFCSYGQKERASDGEILCRA